MICFCIVVGAGTKPPRVLNPPGMRQLINFHSLISLFISWRKSQIIECCLIAEY